MDITLSCSALETVFYYIYKLNDRLGNSERPSFVFKTSKLKALFALNMDETKDHILSKKFWFFLTGKLKDATDLYPLPQVYTTPLYES